MIFCEKIQFFDAFEVDFEKSIFLCFWQHFHLKAPMRHRFCAKISKNMINVLFVILAFSCYFYFFLTPNTHIFRAFCVWGGFCQPPPFNYGATLSFKGKLIQKVRTMKLIVFTWSHLNSEVKHGWPCKYFLGEPEEKSGYCTLQHFIGKCLDQVVFLVLRGLMGRRVACLKVLLLKAHIMLQCIPHYLGYR